MKTLSLFFLDKNTFKSCDVFKYTVFVCCLNFSKLFMNAPYQIKFVLWVVFDKQLLAYKTVFIATNYWIIYLYVLIKVYKPLLFFYKLFNIFIYFYCFLQTLTNLSVFTKKYFEFVYRLKKVRILLTVKLYFS